MNAVRIQFLLGSAIVALCSVTLVAHIGQRSQLSPSSQSAQPPAPVSAPSANSSFGLLEAIAKPDKSIWEDSLRTAGLTRWQGHEGMWRLKASDGEVRAKAFFQGNETSVFLMFFPTARTALSEATLSWMYRTAAGYSFEDGDGIELRFADETITGGTGRRRQSFLLSLTSSTLTRTVVTMEWK